jgi:iron complex outermembrane receptor protein
LDIRVQSGGAPFFTQQILFPNNARLDGSGVNRGANRTTNAVALGFTNPQTTQFMSDYFVQNASFLKLDNVTLGYNFAKILDANISGRIYATVQNVFTITKYDGLDPEVSNGIDNTLYPRPITTVIGLNLNF